MNYSFDEVEYIAEDGTTFWLGGDANLNCHKEEAEPETREQPGVPASLTVESMTVTLHTVALMVNDELFGYIDVKEMDKETLQKLETVTENSLIQTRKSMQANALETTKTNGRRATASQYLKPYI